MDFRSTVVETALYSVIVPAKPNIFNAVEIGCMFNTDEGLSTYLIARYLKNFPGNKQFVSIESDREHINKAIQLLSGTDPGIRNEVTFYCGHSLSLLPQVIQNMESIDFGLLDGGAHPEVCLQEFESVLKRLSTSGLILVDDIQEIKPSESYPLPRPFGKGSLILPFLSIANYLKGRPQYRKANSIISQADSVPDSYLLSMINETDILNAIGVFEFSVITKANHKMLAVGSRLILEKLHAALDGDFTYSQLGEPTLTVSPLNENPSAILEQTGKLTPIRSSTIEPTYERAERVKSCNDSDGVCVARFCAETCIIFVSFGRDEIASRSYASISSAVAPYRDRIKIIISDATHDIRKFEWACSTDADDIIFSPRFTSAATSRNLATSLVLDKYAPKYLCMVEDDFEYQTAWYPALVGAADKLYGAVSPFGLAYGIFSACDHHISAERMMEDPANGVIAYLFGAVAYQRFMPTSHYLGVMRSWDSDLLGISYAQTGGQTFRNTMRGFCGAILPGHLSSPIDSTSSASTWSKGKRDPGPPAHSFIVRDYDVIRNAATIQGTYTRNEKYPHRFYDNL